MWKFPVAYFDQEMVLSSDLSDLKNWIYERILGNVSSDLVPLQFQPSKFKTTEISVSLDARRYSLHEFQADGSHVGASSDVATNAGDKVVIFCLNLIF